MRDRDQPACPLGDRAAAQLGDAVLGHYLVDDVLERRHGSARVQLGNDARDGVLGGARMQHDERLTVLGHHRSARVVGLPAGGGPVIAAERLRRALTEEVHLQRRVDRSHVRLARDHERVVGVVDRVELDTGVLGDELVQAPGAERRGGDDLVAVGLLARAGQRATLDQVDEAVAEQLGVRAELTVLLEHSQHEVRRRADAGLQSRAVGNPFGDERGDLVVALACARRRDLDHRRVGFAIADDV
jgi:hypothetical protein